MSQRISEQELADCQAQVNSNPLNSDKWEEKKRIIGNLVKKGFSVLDIASKTYDGVTSEEYRSEFGDSVMQTNYDAPAHIERQRTRFDNWVQSVKQIIGEIEMGNLSNGE